MRISFFSMSIRIKNCRKKEDINTTIDRGNYEKKIIRKTLIFFIFHHQKYHLLILTNYNL